MSYNKVVKSKLSFKGSSGKLPGIGKGVKRRLDSSSSSAASSAGKDEFGPIGVSEERGEISIENGIGRITSSGTTVHGHETKFMDQLSVGDAIIVSHPTSFKDETKIVRMVLSNISIGISSAFSSDIISTTGFRYIKAPKDLTMSADEIEATKKSKKYAEEVASFGTYAGKEDEIVYRVRKPGAFGGYAIVKESGVASGKTREELLDMRAKKKGDRFCV